MPKPGINYQRRHKIEKNQSILVFFFFHHEIGVVGKNEHHFILLFHRSIVWEPLSWRNSPSPFFKLFFFLKQGWFLFILATVSGPTNLHEILMTYTLFLWHHPALIILNFTTISIIKFSFDFKIKLFFLV